MICIVILFNYCYVYCSKNLHSSYQESLLQKPIESKVIFYFLEFDTLFTLCCLLGSEGLSDSIFQLDVKVVFTLNFLSFSKWVLLVRCDTSVQ